MGYAVANTNSVWNNIYSSASSTPASTSTITMTTDITSIVTKGMGIRFKVGAETTYRHAIITAITNNLLTIKGVPLTTGAGDLKDLWYCSNINLNTLVFDLNAKSLNATNASDILTNLATHGNYLPNIYKGQKGRVVLVETISLSKGSGSNPVVNWKVDAQNSVASNVTIAVDTTWYDTAVTIDPAQNLIDYNSVITMQVLTAAIASTETTVQMTIIYE